MTGFVYILIHRTSNDRQSFLCDKCVIIFYSCVLLKPSFKRMTPGITLRSVLQKLLAPTALAQLETFLEYHIAIIGMKIFPLHFGRLQFQRPIPHDSLTIMFSCSSISTRKISASFLEE